MDTIVNAAWCRVIVEEVLRFGVRDVVVCPGGRAAAMIAALRERKALRLFVHTDERSAGFFALGAALSSGRPAAVCVTSGSSVANLTPALTEAFAVGAPLLVISCDRPRHLRNAGLPQTTDQAALCAPLVVASIDLSDPVDSAHELATLRSSIARLARHLRPGLHQGPVQINVPLAGRLCSVDGEHGWTADRIADEPVRDLHKASKAREPGPPMGDDLETIVSTFELRPGMKGLVVAGPNSRLAPQPVRKVVELSGFPFIADAPGSLRSAGIPGTIAEADILATRSDISSWKPELVVRLGAAPVTASLQQYLAATGAKVLRIDDKPVQRDFLATSLRQLIAPDEQTIAALGHHLAVGNERWREAWIKAARACRVQTDKTVGALGWSESLVVAEAVGCAGFGLVHAANSTPIRLVNMLLPASADERSVYVNRGVSGIDGTIGTFLGELAGSGRAGLLLIGDLAMVHDLPALEICLHARYSGVIVIINNLGAGLFDHLAMRSLPEYEKLYRHPVPIDFSSIARASALVTCGARMTRHFAMR